MVQELHWPTPNWVQELHRHVDSWEVWASHRSKFALQTNRHGPCFLIGLTES
jgi:hypothetical protein